MGMGIPGDLPSWANEYKVVPRHSGTRMVFGVESYREVDTTKDGRRRTFRNIEAAQKRCDELNAFLAKKSGGAL